jgi:nitrogen fixation protein NifX
MSTARHLRVLNSHTDDGFLAAAFRVAFTSTNLTDVDQHFGAAESVAIYAVTPERAQLIEVKEFDIPEHVTGNEDKIAPKLDALDGCIVVYTSAVGAAAMNQLRTMGIQPVKVASGAVINDLIASLQDELRLGPSAWLARTINMLHPRFADRFEAMEAEGWDE